MATHEGVPRLFDHAEIARLNATRPPTDQLELAGLSPGLLKHHCCFPSCPRFLSDLRTESDRAAERAAGAGEGGRAAGRFRRKGLFQHLRWFQWPDRCWTKGLHATALQTLSRRPGMARAQFVEECARQLYQSRDGMSEEEVCRHLELIYDMWKGRGA